MNFEFRLLVLLLMLMMKNWTRIQGRKHTRLIYTRRGRSLGEVIISSHGYVESIAVHLHRIVSFYPDNVSLILRSECTSRRP